MKKLLLNFSSRQFLGAILIFCFMASCSHSPYRYVKVDPKAPIQKVEKTSPQESTDVVASVPVAPTETLADEIKPVATSPVEQGFSPDPNNENDGKHAIVAATDGNVSVASNFAAKAKENKAEPPSTHQVVVNELNKTAEFKELSQRKQERLVKKITKKVERVKAKSNASANSIVFNQWMKIGVILLLVGLVVGLLWGALGWIVSVIGLVFLILGLVQQM